jgi:glucose/arabinose dehydrogenase
MISKLCRLLVAALLLGAPAKAGVFGSDYKEVGRCGPYPRVAVKTPAWLCVGIVAGKAQGLIRPRMLIEIAPRRFVVTDMFGWGDEGKRGRVLRLDVAADGAANVAVLFKGLTTPHGLARGPDGLVYVAEPDRIWRFDPVQDRPAQALVLENLPLEEGGDLHPLKNIIFDAAGALIVSVGAPTDRCELELGDHSNVHHPCAASETGSRPRAALMRVTFDRPGGRVVSVEPHAKGLRNSMALAVHPRSGLLLQGENSLDVFARDAASDPPDELNVVKPGGHYGWPYCSGNGIVTPQYAQDRIDCKKFVAPAALLPPHSAPLGMAYYSGALFPELAGKLIIGFHSLNPRPGNGHRIATYATDADGVPAAKPPEWLVDDWKEKGGLRPQGAPVGMTVAADGSIWFAEDVNETIMVMLRP